MEKKRCYFGRHLSPVREYNLSIMIEWQDRCPRCRKVLKEEWSGLGKEWMNRALKSLMEDQWHIPLIKKYMFRSGHIENDFSLAFFDGKHGARDIYIPADLMDRKPRKPDYWPTVKTPKCPCATCAGRKP